MPFDNEPLGDTVVGSIRRERVNTVPYYHTLAYLRQRKERCSLPRRELFKRSGATNSNKFFRQLDEFPKLTKPLSQVFLQLFEVNLDVLRHCVELDLAAYEEALAAVAVPSHFVIRYMACAYGRKPLPEGLTLQEATEYVREVSLELKRNCCIDIPGILTIWIFGDDVTTQYKRPSLRIGKQSVTLKSVTEPGTVVLA